MPQLFATSVPEAPSPRAILIRRIAGVVIAFVAVLLFLSLVTYDWHDISAQCSPAESPPRNLIGYGGAWFAYLSLSLFGLAALTIPVWVGLIGVRMALQRRIAWRPAGMALVTLAVAGMGNQLGSVSKSVCDAFGPDGVNCAGQAGGTLGALMASSWLVPIIGGAATFFLFLAFLLFGVVLIVGLRSVFRGAFARGSLEDEKPVRRDVTLSEDGEPSEGEEPEAPATPQTPEERRAAREAERGRKAEEREAERQRREEERQAEKERKAAEREAEKQRREEERQAEKDAKLFARQQEEEAKAAAKAAEEEARKEEMRRRTEEFLARQREEEEKRAAEAAARKNAEEEESEETGDAAAADDGADDSDETYEPVEAPHIDYRLPGIEHLKEPPPKVEENAAYTEECGARIVETLGEFGITVSLVGVHRGPVITQYHLLPAPGVRIHKIAGYATDLQRALSAAQVRILAPIPGKSVIGVEVPNEKADIVAIREIAEGDTWKARVAKSPLPLLLGKDIAGADYTADLAAMPHLLIAGATGAGKSAGINSILAGLLLTRTPDELRLIMVDPKFVEFTPYADIPHLIVPIITEPKKVGVALQWAIGEMNRRLKLFAKGGARNIADYNRSPIQGELFRSALDGPGGKLPYVVIVIDELADLMLTAKNEIEGRISNLAAKARAAGIHMIIATQRPSVQVVTGVIKANFPGRIAFKTASAVDSMTILDVHGAESLLGRGDMLVHDPRVMGNTRVQGCWVSDEEVAAITNDLRAQGRPVYVSSIKNKLDAIPTDDEEEEEDDGGGGGSPRGGGSLPEDDGGPVDPNDDEALLRRALEIFRENRRASTSSLQRRLGLGYNRAARVLDKLQERGYIGPPNGNNGPREILVDLDELLDSSPDTSEG